MPTLASIRRQACYRSADVRLLCLGLLALLLEIGWLALWPLSAALSHSAAFTSELLATYIPAARVLHLSLRPFHLFLPELSDTPIAEPLGSDAFFATATALAVVMLFLAAVYVVSLCVLDRSLGARRGAVVIVFTGALMFQITLLF